MKEFFHKFCIWAMAVIAVVGGSALVALIVSIIK
jgi:hypothetical protein